MEQRYLEDILNAVANKEKNVSQALDELKNLPYEDIGYANIDQHRNIRTGQGEVLFGEGKTPAQTAGIVEHMYKNNDRIMVTRANTEHFEAVKKVVPDAVYHEASRIIIIGDLIEESKRKGNVAVVTAGTSDIPIAEEAAISLEFFGNRADRIFDVGVAGIHRLFDRVDRIREADAVIVIAGMEGALASVVGGLVSAPVVACPTSIGYGASLGGLAALLSMLNSCANGVGVVNIDNGYGAACLANKIVAAKG